MFWDSPVCASWSRPSSTLSLLSRSDTTVSRPARRHPATSSSSQSPPRGRPRMARCPFHGPGIQYRSAFIGLLYYLSRKVVDVVSAFGEDHQPMVTIQKRTIRSALEARWRAGNKEAMRSAVSTPRKWSSFVRIRFARECGNRKGGWWLIGMYKGGCAGQRIRPLILL